MGTSRDKSMHISKEGKINVINHLCKVKIREWIENEE